MPTEPQFVDELISLPHRFLIPFTESSGPVQTHEPSQERDVANLSGPSQPRGPEFVQTLIDTVGGEAAAHALAAVWRDANTAKRAKTLVASTGGNTDTSGNMDLLLFSVPNGFELSLTRVNLEAVGFTPASPFSATNAWAATYRGRSFGFGAILDFAPAIAGQRLFPGLWTDSDTQAVKLRGGEDLSLHVVGTGTLASTQIFARIQGSLTEL